MPLSSYAKATAKKKAIEEAKSLFPNETDNDALQHALFFHNDPRGFMQAVIDTYSGLPDDAQKASYAQTVRSFIDRNFDPGQIQTQIWNNRPIGDYFLTYLYPDWGEWFQSMRIVYDLNNWLKDTIYYYNNMLDNETDRQNYSAEINRQLEAYAPENWQEKASKETVLEWIPIFKKAEIEQAQLAAIELQDLKNKKLIGFGLLGAFGLFGLSMLFRKKRA